ncbi:GNAT family N-acetyltransferase [Streptomyces gamaensis]|uniref:GNAT family N-acetyltransferase n=1 Tax=Streptomyces gamaensis TaxID=1763542 RepID=A0ABW0Z1G7_9ACTN
MEHTIRAVRADEWQKVKELRLAALGDPVASIAFLDTYETAAAQPDSFWQERTRRSAAEDGVTTFVAEAPDGSWVGNVTVVVELPGDEGAFGGAPDVPQTHLVGVFVRPGQRGSGIAQALFRAALDWSWGLSAPRTERVRLYVHERNARAEAFYRRLGFERTGVTVPMQGDPTATEYEMAVPRPDC